MPIARCSTERISTVRLVRNIARCCVTGNRFNCSISTKSFQALLHDFRSRSEISAGINSGGLAFVCWLLAVRRVGTASSAMAVSMLASLSSACGEISRVRLVSVSHNRCIESSWRSFANASRFKSRSSWADKNVASQSGAIDPLLVVPSCGSSSTVSLPPVAPSCESWTTNFFLPIFPFWA